MHLCFLHGASVHYRMTLASPASIDSVAAALFKIESGEQQPNSGQWRNSTVQHTGKWITAHVQDRSHRTSPRRSHSTWADYEARWRQYRGQSLQRTWWIREKRTHCAAMASLHLEGESACSRDPIRWQEAPRCEFIRGAVRNQEAAFAVGSFPGH